MTYSQFGQDVWVVRDTGGLRGGFFVEMGAKDGVHFSNTLHLEEAWGWRGLCIEPHPVHYRNLVRNRNCQCVNALVDGEVRVTEFWQAEDGQGGMILPGSCVERMLEKKDGRAKNQVIHLPTRRLADIFVEQRVPREVDYFSLDVEGAEERILRDFPLDLYIFHRFSIERPTELVRSRLWDHGYREEAVLGEDTIFRYRG